MKLASVLLLVLVSAQDRTLAQDPRAPAAAPDDGKREFTISGCLLRSGYAGYQVDDARIEAIDGKPTAEPAASSPPAAPAVPRKWVLEGGGNLGARVGEKVQVVGRSDWQPPPSPAPAADEPPNRLPRLDVKSVKTVAPSCVGVP